MNQHWSLSPGGAAPRASHIRFPGRDVLPTQIWMGGAYSAHGEPLRLDDLAGAWLIDVAGDMPLPYRQACGHQLACAIADFEEVPFELPRLVSLAGSIGAVLQGSIPSPEWRHPNHMPERVYVMCNQGLNRSGLFTGLILRSLGVSGEEAVQAITSRPGALSNQTFRALIHAWPPSR